MRIPWPEFVLFGLAYMLGDAFSAPQWVTIVVGGLIGLGIIGWAIEQWRTRHERRAARKASENHDLVTRADRYRDSQEECRKANELRAFWESAEGQYIYHIARGHQ